MSSTVEFSSLPGKTFSVQQYAADGSTIGAAITGVTDSATPTRYRFTSSATGTVYVVATATNLRVAGYVNLDAATAEDVCAVVSLADLLLQSFAADIDTIIARIQSGQVGIVSPVNQDGSINPIVIGDDYLAVHNRAFDFFIDPVAGASVETSTCMFGGERSHKGAWLVTGSVSVVGDKWRMRFELLGDDTIDLLPACYDWTVTLIPASKRVTRIQGQVEVLASQTVP